MKSYTAARAVNLRRLGLSALAAVLACSSSDDVTDPAADTAAGAGAETSGSADDAAEDDNESAGASADPTDAGGSSSGGRESAGESDSSGAAAPPPEPGLLQGCSANSPNTWIFCEDFEAGHDPGDVFFDYLDADGAFALEGGGGASGLYSMRADYRPGVEGAGFLSISFGENPVSASNRPDYGDGDVFNEIYWRFRMKTEDGWPDVGPGQLTQATALAGADWGQAMVASISSDGEGTTLLGRAATCVVDANVPCEGYEDLEKLAPLGALAGRTDVFSSARSGQWQCIEARVRLNDPGIANGAFEFWVDGELETGRADVDWRGTWADYGLNLISIENFWPGGPTVPLTRWIDDIVVSTEPIGCD